MMLFSLLSIVFLNAIGVYIIDRNAGEKERPVAAGVIFGCVSVGAQILMLMHPNVRLFLCLADIPVATAALFYGTVPGLTAGVISALFRLTTQFWIPTNTWHIACISSLCVAGFEVLTRKFFLGGKRPFLFPSFLCMMFGGFLRFLLYCYADAFNDACTFLPQLPPPLREISAVALAALLVAAVTRNWGNLRANFLNWAILIFVIFDLGCVGIFCISAHFAQKAAEEKVYTGFLSLQKSFLDQVRYMLRDCAVFFVDSEPGMRNYTHEQLKSMAKKTRFDEINVYDSSGKLVGSNDPAILKAGRRLDFQPLQEGPLRTTPIMETGFTEKEMMRPDNVFRLSTPFPDKSGFFEIGMLEKLLFFDYEIMLLPLLKERKFGDSGFFVATGPTGKINIPVFKHPELLGKNIYDLGLSEEDLKKPDYETFRVRFNGQWSLCYKISTSFGDRTFAFLPQWEAYSPYMAQGSMSCLLLLGLLFLAQGVIVSIRRAWKEAETAQQERNAMIEKDLEMARNIQMDELRHDDVSDKHAQVESFIRPAEAVGGDFYDYFRIKNGIIIHVIGDVSGEGISAALFMMKAKTSIRENVRTSSTLAEAVARVNAYLCQNNTSFMFVTLWIGMLDVTTGEGEYICAGHNPPLWLHPDREAEWLPGTSGMALGIFPGAKFVSRRVQLKRGDRIFLYTDGVTEAKNHGNEQFTAARLKKLLEKEAGSDIQRVYKEILAFANGCPQSDDITMLELLYFGTDDEIAEAEKQSGTPRTELGDHLCGQMKQRWQSLKTWT